MSTYLIFSTEKANYKETFFFFSLMLGIEPRALNLPLPLSHTSSPLITFLQKIPRNGISGSNYKHILKAIVKDCLNYISEGLSQFTALAEMWERFWLVIPESVVL
jgi:hypothetical protein